MRLLRKYVFVAVLSARSNVVYMAEVMSRVIFLSMMLYIFACLWRVVFRHSGPTCLGGIDLQQMVWYLTATEALYLSAPRVSASVDLDVRSGALVSYLQRPISYPLYSLSANFGERGIRFLVNLLVGAVVAGMLVGVPHLSLQSLVFFAVTTPLSMVVDFLACFLIGLGAFWLEDTSGLYLIYSKMIMILGGLLFPISLFPDGLRSVIEWLPFAAVMYGPAKMLVAPTSTEFISIVAHQVLGLLFFSLLVYVVYNRASKRVFVNGG